MAASVNDKITDIRNAARPNSARVSSSRSAGGTTLACDNLVGWPTASKVHFVTYQIDSNSDPVPGTQLDCYGIVSSNNIGSFTVVDGTDAGNAVGDVVEMLPTAAWGQDLADGLTAQHSRVGAHVGITNTGGMTTDTLTVSSGTTLPAGDIITANLADSAVTPAKLLTGTGSTWVWQSWVPVIVNITAGDATIVAKYIQVGKIVHVRFKFTAGSTSSFSSSVTISTPVTALAEESGTTVGQATFIDASDPTGPAPGFVRLASATTFNLWYLNANAVGQAITATAPYTFAVGDIIEFRGSYEVA